MKNNEQKAKAVVDAICRDIVQNSKAQAQNRRWYQGYLAWALNGQAVKPVQE